MTKTSKSYLVATDVGGTCTDTVVFAVGEPVILGKALSTPPDFATYQSKLSQARGLVQQALATVKG